MNCPPLKPCPFCGGDMKLEQPVSEYSSMHGTRKFYGVVCRNTNNRGGTCCMEQRPSASIEAAVMRWNMRDGVTDAATIEWFNSQGGINK